VPKFIVTHRLEEQPEDGEFRFVAGVEHAIKAADGEHVSVRAERM
jgi:hypothetical protein